MLTRLQCQRFDKIQGRIDDQECRVDSRASKSTWYSAWQDRGLNSLDFRYHRCIETHNSHTTVTGFQYRLHQAGQRQLLCMLRGLYLHTYADRQTHSSGHLGMQLHITAVRMTNLWPCLLFADIVLYNINGKASLSQDPAKLHHAYCLLKHTQTLNA